MNGMPRGNRPIARLRPGLLVLALLGAGGRLSAAQDTTAAAQSTAATVGSGQLTFVP